MTQNNFLDGKVFPHNFYGRYVILPHEVDIVHDLAPGTTMKLFEDNKDSLQKEEDYYISKRPIYGVIGKPIYLTASGYLKLTDDKELQGKMFNYYFSGMLKTETKKPWQIEINEAIELVREASHLESLKILSLAYCELTNRYALDLNKQKKKYLKAHRDVDYVSILEVVHWLENTGVIPSGALKLCLKKLYDEMCG